jgi:hypothetical protein
MFHAVCRSRRDRARLHGLQAGTGRHKIARNNPLRAARRSAKITGGTHRIDWVFVEDVVTGMLKLAAAPGVGASLSTWLRILDNDKGTGGHDMHAHEDRDPA